MFDNLLSNIIQLGLSNKEASVYLAALSRDGSTVAELSRSARVNRATVYLVIDSLLRKGLIRRERNTKTVRFFAEPPTCLQQLIESEEETIQRKKKVYFSTVPQLNLIFEKGIGLPTFYSKEGPEGLKTLKNIFLTSNAKIVEGFTSRDELLLIDPDESFGKARVERGIHLKLIYTNNSGPLSDEFPTLLPFTEFRFLPSISEGISSGLFVFSDILALWSYHDKFVGIFIRNKEIAKSFKEIFYTVWNSLPSQN